MSKNENMRYLLLNIFLVAYFAISNITAVSAEKPSPELIVTDELNWIAPAPIAGLQFTWIQGSDTATGLYILRVRLASATRIPPHSHPDQRLSTVLSGTLYVGFGEVFDENNMVAIKPGNVYIAPANTPHFIWAKEGAVEYQETGLGPTATHIVKQP